MVRMIELSFTTMNALIHEPHTFLCKYVHGLETFRTPAQEAGSRSHRLVQDHVSGRAEHPGLAHLPFFPHVEQQDCDPRTKVRMPIDADFSFIGYVDGLNPQTGQLLEIKTGARWGRQRFLELAQWQLYAAALPDYREVVFVNCPGSPETWSRECDGLSPPDPAGAPRVRARLHRARDRHHPPHRQLSAQGARAQPLVLLYRLPLLRGRRGAARWGHLPRRR